VSDEQRPESERADAPVAAPAPAAKPLWTYFLTPIAVIIGACIIAGAVWYTNNDDSGSKATVVAAVVTPETDAVSRAPAASTQDVLTVFKGYVAELGMDPNAFVACLSKPESVALVNKQLQRGSALGINGTPTFVINNKMVVGTQPTAVFDEVIAAELKGSPTTLDGYSATIKAMAATSPPGFQILPSKVDVSDAQIEGDRNAKVMIAEFSDFQCPFCKRWTDDTLQHLRPEFGKDVALAFLNFPIPQLHPNAGNASVAAVCAGEQGKFWQMHDLLFQRQTEWAPLKAN
jgi:protein-disulfide isomerase